RENRIADAVVGGVVLAFGEFGGDVDASLGGNRDANIGALVFDVGDGARNRRAIDGATGLFQDETIVAHGEGPAPDGDDVMAADEFRGELGLGVVEDVARRALLLDPSRIHQD